MKLTPEERTEIRKQCFDIGSDGCSKSVDWNQICCFEHDIAYRTGKNFKGETVTKRATDKRFRQCIQEESKFGKFSISAWFRWFGVAVFNFNGGVWGK